MTAQKMFHKALEEVSSFYRESDELMAFCPFPESHELRFRDLKPHHIPSAEFMAGDPSLDAGRFATVRDALVAVKDLAKWRETYKHTNIGEDFLNRFGCYELFGWDGHFDCQSTRGFIVYSDRGLYYPWHHHPAEEMYFILAGEAEFAKEGSEARLLRPGDTAFHAVNQPHNMRTRDSGVLAWVQWRGEMDVSPVLTDRLNGAEGS